MTVRKERELQNDSSFEYIDSNITNSKTCLLSHQSFILKYFLVCEFGKTKKCLSNIYLAKTESI